MSSTTPTFCLKRLLPNFIPLFIFLLCLTTSSCRETPEEVSQKLDKAGNEYFVAKEYQKALDTWNEIATLQSPNAELYKKIGNCYVKLAAYEDAMQTFETVLRLQPEDWYTWLELGKIQLNLMDFGAAEKSWQIFHENIENTACLIFHGDLLIAQRKYHEAILEFVNALNQDPSDQTALARLTLCFLEQNKIDEAKKTYHQLECLEPKTSDTLLQMSYYWVSKSNPQKAEKFIKKALNQDPNNYHLHIEFAKHLIGTSNYKKAIVILQNFLQKSPNNTYIKKMLIETMLMSNLTSDAWGLLNNLSEVEKHDLDFNLLKGKLYLNDLKYYQAISHFQQVVEKEPEHPVAHYLLSLAYLAGGQDKLGHKSLVKALTQNPYFTDAELALADLYYKDRNYDLALKHTERIIKREPENYRCYLIKGNINLALEQYDAAIDEYKTAQALNPEIVSPIYYEAIADIRKGNPEKALRTLDQLKNLRPELIDVTYQYTNLLIAEGKKEEAVMFLKNTSKNNPENALTHYIIGEAYLAMGNKQEAIKSFKKAIAINQGMKSAYLRLFDLYSQEDAMVEKLILNAILKISNFHEAQIRLSDIYCNKGQYQKAIDLLSDALASNPDSPQLANNLAMLYLDYKPEAIDKALYLAQAAQEQLPDNPATTDTLGWAYFKKGMLTRASWLLEKSRELAPDNPLVNYHLGVVFQTEGKNNAALLHYNRAIKLGLHPSLNQQVKNALDNLENMAQ